MPAVTDGFTKDVIDLVTIGERIGNFELRDAVRRIDPENRVDFMKTSVVCTLDPFVNTMPVFLKNIVARAIIEHVDWGAVVSRLVVTPEEN